MKSLAILLGFVCITHLVLAQRNPQDQFPVHQEPQHPIELDHPSEFRPCAGLPGGTGFANDFSSCESYFSCINYVAHESKCPLPFLFNPNGRFGPICDWPFNVDCRRCPETGVHAFPHPYFCAKYTQCINGVALEKECAPGTAFSRSRGRCVVEDAELCQNVNTCGRTEGGVGYAPSTRDCKKYHICHEGQPYGDVRTCADGLAFDSVSNRCVVKEEVTCYPGTPPLSDPGAH